MKKLQFTLLIALFLAMKPAFSQSELTASDNSYAFDHPVQVSNEFASAIPPDEILPDRHYSIMRDNVVLMITGKPYQEVNVVVSNTDGDKVREIYSVTNQKILWQTHQFPSGTYFIVIYVNGAATMMIKVAKECK